MRHAGPAVPHRSSRHDALRYGRHAPQHPIPVRHEYHVARSIPCCPTRPDDTNSRKPCRVAASVFPNDLYAEECDQSTSRGASTWVTGSEHHGRSTVWTAGRVDPGPSAVPAEQQQAQVTGSKHHALFAKQVIPQPSRASLRQPYRYPKHRLMPYTRAVFLAFFAASRTARPTPVATFGFPGSDRHFHGARSKNCGA